MFISVWRYPGQLGKISEKYPVSSGGSGGRSEGRMRGVGARQEEEIVLQTNFAFSLQYFCHSKVSQMQGFWQFVWIYFYKRFSMKIHQKILNHILILYFTCNFRGFFVLFFAKNLEISKIEKFYSREETVMWEREVRINSLWNFGAPLKSSPSQWPIVLYCIHFIYRRYTILVTYTN